MHFILSLAETNYKIKHNSIYYFKYIYLTYDLAVIIIIVASLDTIHTTCNNTIDYTILSIELFPYVDDFYVDIHDKCMSDVRSVSYIPSYFMQTYGDNVMYKWQIHTK